MPLAEILVVEDDPSIATVLTEFLEAKDYGVRHASGPDAAIAEVDACQPDLILMDVGLSADIDGIETARRIKDKYDLPICFVTAYSDEATITRAEETGPAAYLVKPFELGDVIAMVRISLANARRAKARAQAQATPPADPTAPAAPPAAPASDAPPAPPAAPPAKREPQEDALTGLPNRNSVSARLRAEPGVLCATVLTMDHTHILRQRFGGAALDQILFSFSQHLAQNLPENCQLCRWDGPVFAVLLDQSSARDLQREISRVASAALLYHLQLPGRSALLRITSQVKMFADPDPEAIISKIDAHSSEFHHIRR